MDDRRFQQELHAIKQHVFKLSSAYAPDMHSTDPFSHQLGDLKARVASMGERLAGFESSMQQPLRTPDIGTTDHGSGGELESQSRITLPSGPLFWQLFKSLRTDVQSLDGRVATLETNVSNLEDRVDSLDPSRFTPPQSSTGSETFLSATDHKPVVVRSVSSTALPELNPSFIAAETCSPIFINRRLSPAMDHYPEMTTWSSTAAQKFVPRMESDSGFTSSAFGRLQEQNDEILCRMSKMERENETLVHAIQTLAQRQGAQSGCVNYVAELSGGITSERPRISSDGLAFRDREIARMDEQLRNVQDRLKASEEGMALHKAMSEQLKTEYDDISASNRDLAEKNRTLEEQVLGCRSQLQARDAEIEDLHNERAEDHRNLQEWDMSWQRLNARAQTLERIAQEDREERDSALDRVNESERELKRLQEFCEQKDGVLYSQERIVSRGRQLLEERDREIEDLRRSLRAMEDDKEDAIRTSKRLGHLLGEKEVELVDFKASLGPLTSKQSESKTSDDEPYHVIRADTKKNGNRKSSASFGTRAESDHRRAGQHQISTRKASRGITNDGNPFRPLEVISEPIQGSPDQSSPWQRPNDWSRHVKADEQRRRLPYRYGSQAEYVSPEPYLNDDYNSLDRDLDSSPRMTSTRLPLDDTTFWPPLPVTARRMASEADLRTSSCALPAGKKLSKHHSTQGLRRKLQAYVESGTESGAELGGKT